MGEPESPVAAESPPEPAPEASAGADSEPSSPFTAEVLRQLFICVAGWMFAGMAVWILLLDPLPKGESPAWSGWRGRDVLLTITAAFCLRGMESRQIDFFAPRADGRGRPWAAVAGMLLLGIALGPCVEELLFRGVVYAGLRNELGVWAAVPLSALLFGLFHLEAGWTAVAVTTGMGAAFALLVEGSGSLWPAVLAHVLINTKMIAAFVRSLREPEKKNGNREGIVAPISH